jgi:hypothetical protein
MTSTPADRIAIWPFFGAAALIFGLLATWTAVFLVSDSELEAGGDTLRNAIDTSGNELIFRVTSGGLLLAAASLVLFAIGFRRMVESRGATGEIAPRALEFALVISAAALTIGAVARTMVVDNMYDHGENTSALIAIAIDIPLAAWAPIGLAAGAAAVLALRHEVLPAWFGWVSLLVVVLDVLLALGGGAAPMNIPGFFWLLLATIVAFMLSREPSAAPAFAVE